MLARHGLAAGQSPLCLPFSHCFFSIIFTIIIIILIIVVVVVVVVVILICSLRDCSVVSVSDSPC